MLAGSTALAAGLAMPSILRAQVWTPNNVRVVVPFAAGGSADALGRLVADGPGVTAVATYGHTPGHTSHVIASGSEKMFLQGDVTHFPLLFVRNPGWHVWFDQDARMAEATRREIYDMLVAEKMLVQGFHCPFPAVARIEKAGDDYRAVPVLWNPTMSP